MTPLPTTITETPAAAAADAPAARLRIALGRLSRQLRNTSAAADAGLTPTKTSVLLGVDRRGPMRISELVEIEALNPTLLSRTISKLVDAGLLQRDSDAGDRRAAWVRTTEAGHLLAERMRHERTEVVHQGLAALPAGDRALLAQAIPALESLADWLAERPR